MHPRCPPYRVMRIRYNADMAVAVTEAHGVADFLDLRMNDDVVEQHAQARRAHRAHLRDGSAGPLDACSPMYILTDYV